MLRCAKFLAYGFLAQNAPPVKSALTVIVVNDNILPAAVSAAHWPQSRKIKNNQRPGQPREDIMSRVIVSRVIVSRLATLTCVVTALACAPALAEKDGVLRVGVMNDMSVVYSDFQGAGPVLAAQLAAEDFAKQSRRKVEVLAGDHLNKPDVGSAIARRWLDIEGVDMIIDLPNSAVALGVADIVREQNKVVIGSGAGTALLTGEKC